MTTTVSAQKLRVRVFFTQKNGNPLDAYEDAFAVAERPPEAGELTLDLTDRWRCAIADGASEGGYSGDWARQLVSSYIQGGPWLQPALTGLREWFHQQADYWNNEVALSILRTKQPGTPVYSRVQQSLLLIGQSATFAVLELHPSTRQWRGGAIGDALVFQWRGNQLLPERPLPDLNAASFGTHPILINTNKQAQERWIWENVGDFNPTDAYVEAAYQPGDTFLLMTDALAHWFLKMIELGDEGRAALDDFFALDSSMAYQAWVERQRESKALKNDDTTLIRVDVAAEGEEVKPQPGILTPTMGGEDDGVLDPAVPPTLVQSPAPQPEPSPPVFVPTKITPPIDFPEAVNTTLEHWIALFTQFQQRQRSTETIRPELRDEAWKLRTAIFPKPFDTDFIPMLRQWCASTPDPQQYQMRIDALKWVLETLDFRPPYQL